MQGKVGGRWGLCEENVWRKERKPIWRGDRRTEEHHGNTGIGTEKANTFPLY